jgi:GNAT superfamily N-acetyltransferase
MEKELTYGYRITDAEDAVDLDMVCSFLQKESYWAQGRTRRQMRDAIAGSYCLTLEAPNGRAAGFARVITDWATAYYLCDLFVLPEYRGHGLGKRLVEAVVGHPRLKELNGMLMTADAHSLYEKYGFRQDETTLHKFMHRRKPALQPNGSCGAAG